MSVQYFQSKYLYVISRLSGYDYHIWISSKLNIVHCRVLLIICVPQKVKLHVQCCARYSCFAFVNRLVCQVACLFELH
jgi:hypothetical protein